MTSPALRDALESRATYCDELAQQTVGGVREMHRTNAEMFRKAAEALRANSSVPDWNHDLSQAPYNVSLLLACGGVLVGHRTTECAGCEFVDVDRRYCRPTAWMLSPELPVIRRQNIGGP